MTDQEHVSAYSTEYDQLHAEALEALRDADAFVLAVVKADGEKQLLGGTQKGPLILAVLTRVTLDELYRRAIRSAEMIADPAVRGRALADLTTWTPRGSS